MIRQLRFNSSKYSRILWQDKAIKNTNLMSNISRDSWEQEILTSKWHMKCGINFNGGEKWMT